MIIFGHNLTIHVKKGEVLVISAPLSVVINTHNENKTRKRTKREFQDWRSKTALKYAWKTRFFNQQ